VTKNEASWTRNFRISTRFNRPEMGVGRRNWVLGETKFQTHEVYEINKEKRVFIGEDRRKESVHYV